MTAVLLLLSGLAICGELLVEASLPTEVHVNGQPVVQVFYPAEVRVEVETGEVELTVYVAGNPTRHRVEIPEEGTAVVIVGRTGITTSQRPPSTTPAAHGLLPVELRSAASGQVMIAIDGERHWVDPGEALNLELAPGVHPLSVRNGEGTLVWARGSLYLRDEDGQILIQVAEGVLPEVASGAATFSASDHR